MNRKIIRFFLYVLLIVLAFSYLYPPFYMFANSLKTQTEYMVNPFSAPVFSGSYRNYAISFFNFNILRYFANTLLVVIAKLLVTLPIAICASYAFAKLSFPGKDKIYLGILIGMFIPFQVIMIPIYVFFAKIKLLDTFFGFIFFGVAMGQPATILLLASNFKGIPNELIESGKIDGCGYFRTVWNIIVPMGIPAIAINVIIGFISGWNDLLGPMLLLRNIDKQLIMPALSMLVQQRTANVPLQMAGVLIATIPAVIIYVILQKQIIMGVSVGSFK
ncbi:sugar ABC transporter permease [Spirochaetia bacterium]|nr:sugar ABC transporter permease [Spirochaetia bacterium]